MPTRYRLGCQLSYHLPQPAVFIFNVQIAHLQRHADLIETLRLTPETPLKTYSLPDVGNRYIRLQADAGPLTLEYQAEVTLDPYRGDPMRLCETPVQSLPPEIMAYLLPSRYVPSDQLSDYARHEFGHLYAGYSRVTAICNWIYAHITYRRGVSDAHTTATDTLLQRAGVCRDFAHLGIAFCRALDIPARFVSGYAYGLKPADFHAAFEVWLDGHWWLFDATRQAHLDGFIRIAAGRDAADSAFCMEFGGNSDAGNINIHIERLGNFSDSDALTTDAISTDTPVGLDSKPET
ncbi:MAG: transglutaminase family protein [Asticcacaulis sp.]